MQRGERGGWGLVGVVVWSSSRRAAAHLMYSDARAAAHVKDESVSAAACRTFCQPLRFVFSTNQGVLTKAAKRPTECASSSASEELSKQLFGAYLFVEHGSASSASWSALGRKSRERRGSGGSRCSREARLRIAAELVVL